MKRFVAYRLVAAFCCLVLSASLYAQDNLIEVHNKNICKGDAVTLDGSIYVKLDASCTITSIKADGQAEELKDKPVLSPTTTTQYTIWYSGGGATQTATFTITVMEKPSLNVSVTGGKTVYCPNDEISLKATVTPSDQEVFWVVTKDRYSSDAMSSGKGLETTQNLKNGSCWITFQAYNTCGVVEVPNYFKVEDQPDLSNVRLRLNSEIKGPFCIDCGFFPRAEDIVLGATQGTIKESSVTWEDGTTTEEIIKAGSFSKKVKVHAVVEQSAGTCGASSTVSRTIDTVINLTVSGGIDCKPTVQTTVSVKPCRDGEVQLRNYSKNFCTIQGRPTLTADPAHPKIVVEEKEDFPYDIGNEREQYRWNVRWENYAKTDAQPSLTANANYSISCPYSKSKPTITGTLKQKVSVTIDTSYLTFKYEYCPDGKATLEIKGQENVVTIKEITLTKPTGTFSAMFSGTDIKSHQCTYTSVDAITTALLTKYAEIRLKVKFDVKDGNCQFSLEREEIVRLKQKNNCTMDFQMVETGSCIGEPRTFRLANADGAEADYIEVEPHSVFTFKVNAEQRTMEPYYAGAPGIPSQKDSITATIYYHMQGSLESLSMTKKFPIVVRSCPPKMPDNISITNTGCPMCPGAQMIGRIWFENPTTQESKIKVDIVSTAVVQIHEKEGGYNQKNREYSMRRVLFGDMDYRIAVTYNEGDSIYQNRKMSFTMSLKGDRGFGEEATDSTIKMTKLCNLEKEASPDSVCEGEPVDLYVYSRNFGYETLENITWGNPSVQAVGTGLEDWADYQYADEKGADKTKKIKRFHYRVASVNGDGIYPYLIRTKIGDSVLEHRDTIRVSILKNLRIFTEDTVYACEGEPFSVWKYVDSSVVDVTTVQPQDFKYSVVEKFAQRTAQASARYKCSKLLEDKIVIIGDAPVYGIASADKEAYCPGEPVTLRAATNGRITWIKWKKLKDGGLSTPDTLCFNAPKEEVVSDVMDKEDCMYQFETRTGCAVPPCDRTVFWVNAKPVPDVSIIDNSACKPEPLVLQTKPFDPAEVDSAKDVKWYVNGSAYTLATVPPADNVTVKCEVTGKNGCSNSAELIMHSYNAPTIKIGINGNPGFTGRTYCATQNERIHFIAQGAETYAWSSKAGVAASSASEYIFKVVSDDVLYVVGAESQKGCQTKDSVSIVLKPKAEVQSDTIACLGEDFTIMPVIEAGVNISLTDPAGKVCDCSWIPVQAYDPGDTGVYVFKFNRNGCEESREVHLRMYPVPDFVFADTAFCQDDNLKLDVNTGLTSDWLRQSHFIWKRNGVELPNQTGNPSYTGGKLNLSDAGDYELEIQVNRCVNKGSVNVRVDAHSHPSFPVDSFYCEGTDFETSAEDQGYGAIYEWYSDNRPHIGSSPTTPLKLGALEMDDNGYLKLTVYRGACVDDTSIFIHVRSMPQPELQAVGAKEDEKGFFYCEGSPIRLDVPDAQGNETIEWYHNGERIEGADLGSYGISSSTLENGGLYVFKVERNGCFGADSLYVGVRPLPEPLVSDTFMCSGHIFAVDASNPLYPGATFRWTPIGTTGATAEINTGGQYSVVMTYEGCEGSKSFVVDERPSPNIGFPADTVMCQRDSILLAGPDAMEIYRWQDGASGQTYMVNTEGLYTLYVELMGCSDYNEVFVHEDFCSNLYFPSAFTPNGDGVNDFFAPITTAEDDQVVYSLYIYNRSGEKVFESHSMTEAWDGNFKGSKCPAGVYIYRCKAHAKQNGRNLSANGTVTLIR